MAKRATPGPDSVSVTAPAANRGGFGDVIVDRIERLSEITDEPGRLTRLYLNAAHKRAIDVVAGWMQDAGMRVRIDPLGTVVGRYDAAAGPDAPVLLLGSHIDTVRDAGRYDGTLGVLAAIAVVEALQRARKRLPFAVEVVAFGDEEGVRFPGTLTGSRALAGRFEPRVLDEVDRDGVTRLQALRAFGYEPSQIAAEARDPSKVIGYLEVHIEQGPVLEAEDRPLGVVTAIAGASRGRVKVTGPGGHAGTVPMSLRRDALTAAAAMIGEVERRGRQTNDLVATVGVVEIADAAVNTVPREVSFTIDVRSPRDADRLAAIADLQSAFRKIGEERGVDVAVTLSYEAPAAASDPGLIGALTAAMKRNGLTERCLVSGAGHDAMSFRDRIPFAMLFVRCRGGISHHPDEYAALADIDVAARVLHDCVVGLAAER